MQSDIFCFLLVTSCGDPGSVAINLHPRACPGLPSVFGVCGVDDEDDEDDDDDDDGDDNDDGVGVTVVGF